MRVMRVEPSGIGSVLHVTNRGVRGVNIVCDEEYRKRFVRSLYYLNDTHTDPYWHSAVADIPSFSRPAGWPEREPIVHVLGWTLLSNHFHLLLQEITEGGVAKFMQRLGGSMSTCFNAKYQERGSLFQGSYHARLISQDEHRQYLVFYVLVKNVLEMYPGGLLNAYSDFDHAWEWAVKYSYSSLRDCISKEASPIIDDPEELIGSFIDSGNAYKKEAQELLGFHLQSRGEEFKNIMLEDW